MGERERRMQTCVLFISHLYFVQDVGRCLAVLVHSVDKADLRLESLAQENKDLDKHSRVALDDVAKLSQLKMDFDSL